MTDDDIARLRALLAACGTPRPWRAQVRPDGAETVIADVNGLCVAVGMIAAESDLIVAAVNALPSLLDRIATLTEHRARLREYVRDPRASVDGVHARDCLYYRWYASSRPGHRPACTCGLTAALEGT